MAKTLNENRTVGIYGDSESVRGMKTVDDIVRYLRSRGLKVFDACGNMESGWDMNVSGPPSKLFAAIVHTFQGYNCNTVEEFINEYAIDEIIGFECGVLLSPEHDEFDYYSCNNPDLPFGFYDEGQSVHCRVDLTKVRQRAKSYVENGVEGTYAIVSDQGYTEDFDIEDLALEYTFFKNANEVLYSVCKKDGQLIEGFLEAELEKLKIKDTLLSFYEFHVIDDEIKELGHSVYFSYNGELDYDTATQLAIKNDLLDVDDIDFIDSFNIITKEEYEKATNGYDCSLDHKLANAAERSEESKSTVGAEINKDVELE